MADGPPGRPQISGSLVAWSVYDAFANGAVYVNNLASNTTTRIASGFTDGDSDISGTNVVYSLSRNPGGSVIVHDLNAHTDRLISDTSYDYPAPSICGSRVVWSDLATVQETLPTGPSSWRYQTLRMYDVTSGYNGNATNDYLLDGSGAVQCTTCHAVHNADSNSLTVDKR